MLITDFHTWPNDEKQWYWVTQYVSAHPGTTLDRMKAFFRDHEGLYGEFVEAVVSELEAGMFIIQIDGKYYLN